MVTLPAGLLRHEILVNREPPAGSTLRGIVDDVFLPLVRATVSG